MKDLNKEAKKVTRMHQRKINGGKYLVNANSMERQGTKLAWHVARQPGCVIRFRNEAVVGVS